MPATTAPAIGATQNIQSCKIAVPPENSAGPVLRAGLTLVLVTGIEIRWISVSPRPMAIGAKAAGGDKPQRHGRVQVTAGDVANRKGHGQHRQAEGEGHPDEADADLRKFGRQYGAAAAAEDEPERAEEFGRELSLHHRKYSLRKRAEPSTKAVPNT